MGYSTPIAGETHDIVIQKGDDLMGFMLYRERSKPQAQRINVAIPQVREGNDPAYVKGLDSVVSIASLHHGIDRLDYETGDLRAYEASNVDISREGYITLASQWASSDASAGNATCPIIVEFFDEDDNFDYICVGVGTKLRLYDDSTGTWADEQPSGGPFADDVVHMFMHNDLLFVALAGDNDMWVWDGTKSSGWSQPVSSPAAGFAAKWFCLYGDTIYAAGHTVGSGPSDELYAGTDDGATWTKGTDVGNPQVSINTIWVAEDAIMIGKPEGLFFYDGTNLKNLWPDVDRNAENFVMGTLFEGFSYTNKLDTVRKITITSGENFTDITPYMEGTEDKELYGHGIPICFFHGPHNLFVAFKNGEGATTDYPELLKYNGIGWHQVYKGDAGDTMYAAGYSTQEGWILVNVEGVTYRKRVVNLGESEFPDFDTATEGYVILPYMDGGFPDTVKDFKTFGLTTENCTDDRTVKVYEEVDDGGFTLRQTITTNSRHPIPLGGLDGLAGFRGRVKIGLVTDDSGETPRVRLDVTYTMFPISQEILGYTYNLMLGEGIKLKSAAAGLETVTRNQQDNFLKDIAQSQETIVLTDPRGRRHRIRNTNRAITFDYDRLDERAFDLCQVTFGEVLSLKEAQLQVTLEQSVSMTLTTQTQPDWEFDDTWDLLGWVMYSS